MNAHFKTLYTIGLLLCLGTAPDIGAEEKPIMDNLVGQRAPGVIKTGSQFITERDIAERYQTSRPTANKALSSLVSAGLLEVRRGVGTFVRKSVLDYDLERLVSFTDKARAGGKKPSTELVEFRTVPANEAPIEITRSLKMQAEVALIYMERVRLADVCLCSARKLLLRGRAGIARELGREGAWPAKPCKERDLPSPPKECRLPAVTPLHSVLGKRQATFWSVNHEGLFRRY